jgi:hypothetical protein
MSPLPLGEGQGEGLRPPSDNTRDDPHPRPLPEGEGAHYYGPRSTVSPCSVRTSSMLGVTVGS